MNNESVFKYVLEKIASIDVNKNVNNFLVSIKDTVKTLKEKVMKECDKKDVSVNDFKGMYNSVYESLKEEALENGDEPPKKVKFTSLSIGEKSRRKKIHKVAKEILADKMIDKSIRTHIFNEFCSDRIRRVNNAFILQMAPTYQDVEKYAKAFENVRNGVKVEENKALIKDFVINSLNKCKEVIDHLATIKSQEEMINYVKDNYMAITTFQELQRGRMATIQNDFGIKLPDNLVNEWENYYADQGMAINDYLMVLNSYSNPLYLEMNLEEAFVASETIQFNLGFLNDSQRNKFSFEDDIEKGRFNTVDGIRKNLSLLSDLPGIQKLRGDNVEYSRSISTISNNIKFKLHLDYPELKVDECFFYDDNNEIVQKEEALERIAKGELFRLADKDNKQVMKIKVDQDKSLSFLLDFENKKNFNIKNIFENKMNVLKSIKTRIEEKRKMKFDDVKEDLESLKSDLKDEVNVEVRKNLEAIYKEIKKETPWYKNNRWHKEIFRVKNVIKDMLDSDLSNNNTIKGKMENANEIIDEYLTGRLLKTNRRKANSSNRRENLMLKVKNVFSDVSRQFESIHELENEMVTASGRIKELQSEKNMRNNLELDLELLKVVEENVKEESIKAPEKEKDDIIIEINEPQNKI